LPERYFLVVARLIPQKNLDTLFHAFADYRLRAGCDVWKLVLVGDGPLKDQLYKLRSRLAQSESIQFVGFEQYEQLPIYYGLASAFVLPSVSETWGLVVNEAMSAGLPVLVSNRCGCARDLVREGVNGFTFDPFSRAELSHCLVRASTHRRLQVFGQASQEVIRQWGPDRFASGLLNAARTALSVNPPPRQSPAQRAVLALVNRR
jgi:glycosyltransferase involved in cell wall biosynthesis